MYKKGRAVEETLPFKNPSYGQGSSGIVPCADSGLNLPPILVQTCH